MLHHGNCEHFVYASSTAVYGNQPVPFVENQQLSPLNAYGRSKMRFDNYALEFANRYNVNMVGLRFCNVYGPGEEHKGPRASMITQLARKLMDGDRLKLFGDGSELREWIYVNDVVKANLLAMNFEGREIFNCATGIPYTFNEVVSALHEYFQEKYDPYFYKPNLDIEFIENPHLDRYQNHVKTDMSKAEKILGFTPDFDIKDGIKDYL